MRPELVARMLPWVVQAELDARPSGPLAALLGVMDALHARTEAVLDDVDAYFAPYRAPDVFVPYLSTWVDLDWLTLADPESGARAAVPGGTGRLRTLLVASSGLSALRGTARGLATAVDLVTGVPGARVEPVSEQDFAARLLLPAAARQHLELVRRVVAEQKPAHVTVEVVVDDPQDASTEGRE